MLRTCARDVLRRGGCSRGPAEHMGASGGGWVGAGVLRRRRLQQLQQQQRHVSVGGGGGGGGGYKDGVRQANEMSAAEMEELSVFNAVGGLVAAATGGIAVFVIGAGATLGVASGAAAALGACAPALHTVGRGGGGGLTRRG